MPYLTRPDRRIAERASRYGMAFDARRRGLARDQGDDPFEALIEFLETRLSPEDLDEVGTILARYEDSAVANHGDRRRYGRDEPPPFPGRPMPGGRIDPTDRLSQAGLVNDPNRPYDTEGQDRARRRAAEDARRRHAQDGMAFDGRGQVSRSGFDARFPSAAKIGVR